MLTYHRAKKSREAICPDCSKLTRDNEQQCYWCDSTFSDERGVISRGGSAGGNEQAFQNIKNALRGGESEEGKEQAVIGVLGAAKAAGIHVLDKPVSREEWDQTYKKKWKAGELP